MFIVYHKANMLPQYKMVLINVIASIILITCLLLYKFIYSRKKINLFVLLILISILPLISVLREGIYESGDLSLHVAFLIPFFDSLKEGNIPPIWNEYVLHGYGYPLYLFIYPLPYYFSSFFHSVGFSFINSIKIILIFAYIFSGIGMYVFVKEELKNSISAFTASIFYLFAPYHLVDMHFRVAIGENLAFMFLPFCFYSIKKMSSSLSRIWIIFFSISFALLILSHQAVSLISVPFLFVYVFLLYRRIKQKKEFIVFASTAFLISLLLSLFYWFPVIIEARYTNLFSKNSVSFPSFFDFIYSPWRWGFLYQGHKGELSFVVGYMHWLVIFLSPILLFKKSFSSFKTLFSLKKIKSSEKQLYCISIISFLIVFIMMQEISKPIWMSIFLLKGFQFSYRLLIFSAFFSAIIAGILSIKIKRRIIIYLICIATVSLTILNWGNRNTIPEITDNILRASLLQSLNKVGPGTTIWTITDDKLKQKKSNIDVFYGNAKIKQINRNSTKHEYLINVLSQSATFRENTLYFPNWIVKSNNKTVPFTYEDITFPGLIVFNLKKGLYKIEIEFLDTKVRSVSKNISFGTLVFISFYVLYSFTRKSKNSPLSKK